MDIFGMPKERPCECICHNDGTLNFPHVMGCCRREGAKYRGEDGELDPLRWKEFNGQ